MSLKNIRSYLWLEGTTVNHCLRSQEILLEPLAITTKPVQQRDINWPFKKKKKKYSSHCTSESAVEKTTNMEDPVVHSFFSTRHTSIQHNRAIVPVLTFFRLPYPSIIYAINVNTVAEKSGLKPFRNT